MLETLRLFLQGFGRLEMIYLLKLKVAVVWSLIVKVQ